MSEQQTTDGAGTEGDALSENFKKLAEQQQRLFSAVLRQYGNGNNGPFDPAAVGNAFMRMTQQMLANPQKMAEAQAALWGEYMALWQNTAQRFAGSEVAPYAAPAEGDRRFRDTAWQENQLFDLLKQSYLVTSRWLQKTVADVEGLDDDTRLKVDFYTRQFVDAMAPTNFLYTNPEVLKETYETHGENLVRGIENLIHDLESGKGISQTDFEAFEVGRNVAVTPGKVVYQNRLFQLVQYAPSTEQVYRVPLLICPPWINKYYILDLKPENSFVRWAVAQGFTVFMVSWVNPDASYAGTTFEDYMTEGLIEAMNAVEKATGEKKVNVIGYCIGGTLFAATLAWMAEKKIERVNAATFFTALVDFKEAGDVRVFIDEEQLKLLEQHMDDTGVLDGRKMAATFNMMRANDLIWSFVINNYLMGKDPIPFDLLYWNADGTNLPAAMHSYYLRNMYMKNLLSEPGGLTLGGVPIDLRKIDLPTYVLATKEDHIAPWRSCYRLTQLIRSKARFVLARSGHVAGVVSAPGKTKYDHWTNEALPESPTAWLDGAEVAKGSWWPDWAAWLSERSGEKVAPREPGKGGLEAIEDAPGSYVRKTIE